MDPWSNRIVEVVREVKSSVLKINTYAQKNGKEVTKGSGSGFLFSSDGYLFTNSHVVQGGSRFTVSQEDGSTTEALLVGEDPDRDLAVLKVLFQLQNLYF